MKLENKRKAQEQRAKARARKALQVKILKIVEWVLIIAVVAAIIVGIVLSIINAKKNSSASTDTTATETSSDAETDSSSTGTELNTTEGIAVQMGDKINLDYTGYVDDVAFDNGSTNGQGTDIIIGQANYIDDFEEQLVGHTIGETFDIYVTFPEKYPQNPDLAGVEAKFTITLNGVYQ